MINDTDGELLPDPSIYLTVTRPECEHILSPSTNLDAAHRLLRYLKKESGTSFFSSTTNLLLPILIKIAKSSFSASIGTIKNKSDGSCCTRFGGSREVLVSPMMGFP